MRYLYTQHSLYQGFINRLLVLLNDKNPAVLNIIESNFLH